MPDERSNDPKDEETPLDESTSEAPPAPKNSDLRVSSHQDLGVRVSRDLNAGGWLARGDRSSMSKLRFSVQAKPRDEPDPELQALRDPASPHRPARDGTTGPPSPSSSAASSPPPAPAPPEDAAEKPDGGLLDRLGRLFRSE